MQEGEESFHELRQTQLNELEVIQSMYPTSDDFQRLTSEEHFRQIQENMTLNDGLSIRFLIQEIDHLTLEFEMPLRYPEESLHVHVSQPYLQKECCQELQRVANETAERSKGGEAVLDVIGVVVGKFQEMKAHQKEHDEDEAQAQAASVPTAAPVLGRRLLWFHHIKSPKKKRSIVEWARELGLQGMAKPGYPGILFVEGEESNCAEYVHRLKRLRWYEKTVTFLLLNLFP